MLASVRDLIVRLMIFVARAVLSRALSASSSASPEAFFETVLFFVFPPTGVFVARVVDFDLGAGCSDSGSNKSFNDTTVVGVQLDVVETAALIASIFACSEAMDAYVCKFLKHVITTDQETPKQNDPNWTKKDKCCILVNPNRAWLAFASP